MSLLRPAADVLVHFGLGTLDLDDGDRVTGHNSVTEAWMDADPTGWRLRDVLAPGAAAYWEMAVRPQLHAQGEVGDVAVSLRDGRRVLAFATTADDATAILFVPADERHRFNQGMDAVQQRATEGADQARHLEDLAQMRSAFLNAIAHETSTPMTPIRLQLAVLKRNRDPDVQAKALQAIEKNLDRLERFHRGLREAARTHAGRSSIARSPLALHALVDHRVLAWQEMYHRKFMVRGEVTVEADAEAVATCLDHLVDNAVRFSPPDTPIRIRIIDRRIEIRDDGRGIPPARIETLGRPFIKAHEDRENAILGAGLGLFVVAGLMKAMGGRLQLRSRGLGTGTTASLHFSTRRAAPPPS